MKAVVLLSGGLDSATVLAWARGLAARSTASRTLAASWPVGTPSAEAISFASSAQRAPSASPKGLSGRVDARSSPTSFALAPFSSPALSLYSRPRA